MKILIGVPCMEQLPLEYVESILKLIRPCVCDVMHIPNSLVYTSRDTLAQIAVKKCYDYLLFVDSDMTFEPRALNKLLERDADIVSGLYFKRKAPYDPVVYKEVGMRFATDAIAETEFDIDRAYFAVKGCGMGFCLIKTEVLKSIFESSISCFEPLPGLGEDLSFCFRATQKGFKIMCDSTIDIGHISKTVIKRGEYDAYRS